MAAVSFARRYSSTPTTITINSASLPSWLTAIPSGSWASVSLNTTSSITTGNAFMSAGRSLDRLFSDYSGGVWNPHFGTYGAWMFMGGGHSSESVRLDNGVYAWDASDRLWKQVGATTYPGSLGTSYWPPALSSAAGDANYQYPEPFTTYCELTSGIPASYHSRWTLCVLPPSLGGGAYGSFISAQMAAVHVGGSTKSFTAHKLDIASSGSGTWSRLGPRNESAQTNDERAWVGCLDTTRGRVVQMSNQGFWWLDATNPTAWSSMVNPSGFNGSGFMNQPMVYAPELDCFIVASGSFGLMVKTASDLYGNTMGSASAVTATGTPPAAQPNESTGLTWCPDLGTYGAVVAIDYNNYAVKACYAPSNPTSGSWTWATLSSSNSPTFSWTEYDGGAKGQAYSKFQYAPALKAFFVSIGSNGAMWCFRPSEIV